MENQEEVLRYLQMNDPKVFKTVFDTLTCEMIDLATRLLGNHSMGNEIVTRIWANSLQDSFEEVELPIRNYFINQVKLQCDIVKLVYFSNIQLDQI